MSVKTSKQVLWFIEKAEIKVNQAQHMHSATSNRDRTRHIVIVITMRLRFISYREILYLLIAAINSQ